MPKSSSKRKRKANATNASATKKQTIEVSTARCIILLRPCNVEEENQKLKSKFKLVCLFIIMVIFVHVINLIFFFISRKSFREKGSHCSFYGALATQKSRIQNPSTPKVNNKIITAITVINAMFEISK